MSTKKSIYFADYQEWVLGDITSQRVNEVIDRYWEIIKRQKVEKRFETQEWKSLISKLCEHLLAERQLKEGSPRAPLVKAYISSVLADHPDTDPGLLAKIQELTTAEAIAVMEAVDSELRLHRGPAES